MPSFIIDTNVDVEPQQKRYMASFFRDMLRLNGYQIVIGGSKMKAEMQKKEKLLRLVSNYNTIRRVNKLDDLQVDQRADEIENSTRHRLGAVPACCDDFHILAIAAISGCRNIITHDTRLSDCVNQIRNPVGHGVCPDIRNIQTEATYTRLKNQGQL